MKYFYSAIVHPVGNVNITKELINGFFEDNESQLTTYPGEVMQELVSSIARTMKCLESQVFITNISKVG